MNVPNQRINHLVQHFLWATALCGMLSGCARLCPDAPSQALAPPALERALQKVRAKHAPDSHLDIFEVGVTRERGSLVITGEVTSATVKADLLAAARDAGFDLSDRIQVLPKAELASTPWGLVCLSVANGREQPQNQAEMGTQVLMGNPVRVWKRSHIWYRVQTADRYVAWMEEGSFQLSTAAEVDAWNQSPLLIVTAFEDRVLEEPQASAQPVTDVVMGGLLKKTGERGDWFKVALPDQRTGYLPKRSAADYSEWKRSRHATPDNIERTARSLLGRPYLWGANSPKGLDCSGFTKFVFFLNGIDLARNASHQANQGIEVPLDADLSKLKKGDLLFFGSRSSASHRGRVTHAGIYLGDKLFIHSSERVRINSLDPHSPLRDEHRIRSLIGARRVLPE